MQPRDLSLNSVISSPPPGPTKRCYPGTKPGTFLSRCSVACRLWVPEPSGITDNRVAEPQGIPRLSCFVGAATSHPDSQAGFYRPAPPPGAPPRPAPPPSMLRALLTTCQLSGNKLSAAQRILTSPQCSDPTSTTQYLASHHHRRTGSPSRAVSGCS